MLHKPGTTLKKTLYMFEKSPLFLDVEAFCIFNFYELPADLSECRSYLFHIVKEKNVLNQDKNTSEKTPKVKITSTAGRHHAFLTRYWC